MAQIVFITFFNTGPITVTERHDLIKCRNRSMGIVIAGSDLPVENALRGEKLERSKGRGRRILPPNELGLSFRIPNDCAKFHQNRVKIATTDRRY